MKRNYLEFMVSDMLMQFRGENCTNNNVMISAFAKQLQDLIECFQQLEDRTYLRYVHENEDDVSLKDGAHNIHLDRIGEIVDLTRKQASFVSSKVKSTEDLEKSGDEKHDKLIDFIKSSNFSLYYPDDVLSDPEYSKYLYYKVFLNSSYCTYDDVLKSIKAFWTKTPVFYEERESYPATIFLKTPELKPEDNARLFFLAPVVKSAGVGLFREAVTVDETRTAQTYICGYLFPGIFDSELPYFYVDVPFDNSIYTPSRLENIVSHESSYDLYENMFIFGKIDGMCIVSGKREYFEKQKGVVFPTFFRGVPVTRITSVVFGQSWRGENITESIVLPLYVERIDDNAFEYCVSLKQIEFPKTLKYLGFQSFYCCSSLEVVTFALDCELDVIKQSTFVECRKLHTIVLPESIKKIEDYAFVGCYNMKNVIFGGTKKQWESISIGKVNDNLTNANIIFLGGE